jgi:hypothetical protein
MASRIEIELSDEESDRRPHLTSRIVEACACRIAKLLVVHIIWLLRWRPSLCPLRMQAGWGGAQRQNFQAATADHLLM